MVGPQSHAKYLSLCKGHVGLMTQVQAYGYSSQGLCAAGLTGLTAVTGRALAASALTPRVAVFSSVQKLE